LSLPVPGLQYARLFIDHECKAGGNETEKFFSKITKPDNVEDALDDVVDGIVQVAAINHAALEAFKRSKPARFAKLKEVATSQPFPPAVVAYYSKTIDDATLKRIKNGLLNAARKERGQTFLTLFRLTDFITPPDDFAKVCAETRKNYPAPPDKVK
jgi:ABC-type phosphate/phosphonate transport system substrate-binding protein